MFTVDSMNVIDATHQGNKARFINHHCQVNERIHQMKSIDSFSSRIVLRRLSFPMVLNILSSMH